MRGGKEVGQKEEGEGQRRGVERRRDNEVQTSKMMHPGSQRRHKLG